MQSSDILSQKPGHNPGFIWHAGRFRFPVGVTDPTIVMGIVNVTPDSFSDGGQFFETDRAVAQGEQLVADGAAVLDVGGESTRPGSPEVPLADELTRVVPVVAALARKGYCVSVDTKKAEVMRAAIDAGAAIINDIAALRAPGALEACAQADVGVVLMHMQGEPGTMQVAPHYDDVVREVGEFLSQRAQACEAAGIAAERIMFDPGYGFGKTLEHNLHLTRNQTQLLRYGYPVLAGWSRKRTLGTLTGREIAADRVAASVGAALACVHHGARVVRVHDVAATVDALKVWHAFVQNGSDRESSVA